MNYPLMTPLERYARFSEELNIDLCVKRDDFYPFVGGGSKGRKMHSILDDIQNKKANALVSAGANNSNHARAVALLAAQKGWPVKLIIHDKERYSSGNLLIMNLAGAELIFVNKNNVSAAMDKAMLDFKENGLSPYYIHGGGHNIYGMKAFYDAVAEVKQQLGAWIPDYIIHASGTGGTQAGLHVGAEEYYPKTKVVGISVARKKQRGQEVIKKGIDELRHYLKLGSSQKEVIFYDDWIEQGYNSIYPELKTVIRKSAEYGLITDPTYTGKALLGLVDLCKRGEIQKGSKVLFWHTGGVLNLVSNWKRIV